MTKYRLLIVDDEELIRRGLRAKIHSFHFDDLEIDEAGSGAEALRKFEQGETAIAIVDISMPDMNGLEMIAKAKEISPDTRFILLSGYAEFAYAQRAIQLRVQAYLNKPVSSETLRENLEKALSELRSAAPSGAERQDQTPFDPERELNLLLSGEVSEERIAESCPGLCRRYPELMNGQCRTYLAIVHLGRRSDDKNSQTGGRLNAIRQAVRGIFEEAPCDCERLIVNSYQNPQRLYALFMDGDGRRLRRSLETVFLTVHPELERRVSARVTMGVSRMTSRPGPDSLGDARAALRQRNVHGRSNIYFYEDVAAMELEPFPEAEMELLRKCMERGDKAGVHRQMKQLLSEKQMESRREVYLHVLWVRIVGMAMRMYNDMDSAMVNRMLSQLSRVEAMSCSDEISALTELIDDCLDRIAGREMNTADKISYATDYIREHFSEEIVINDLAAKLDMSPGYFSSIFKKETGQSTMQYVTGLRVERAKEYLVETNLSVAVIARDVGYSDSQYFYRVFKRTTGMTPLQYRQEFREE